MNQITILLLSLMVLSGCSSLQNSSESLKAVETTSSHQNQKQSSECKNTETSFNCVSVVEVYDGDSIFIDLPDQHPLFGKRMGVRISGIDTPELKTKDACEKKRGQEARVILQAMISKGNRIDIVSVEKDKFFRILGTVLVDGRSVSDELIKRKVAYPYGGEKKIKRNWCF